MIIVGIWFGIWLRGAGVIALLMIGSVSKPSLTECSEQASEFVIESHACALHVFCIGVKIGTLSEFGVDKRSRALLE